MGNPVTIVGVDFRQGQAFTSLGFSMPIVGYFDDDGYQVFDLRDATKFVAAWNASVYFGRMADWCSVTVH